MILFAPASKRSIAGRRRYASTSLEVHRKRVASLPINYQVPFKASTGSLAELFIAVATLYDHIQKELRANAEIVVRLGTKSVRGTMMNCSDGDVFW